MWWLSEANQPHDLHSGGWFFHPLGKKVLRTQRSEGARRALSAAHTSAKVTVQRSCSTRLGRKDEEPLRSPSVNLLSAQISPFGRPKVAKRLRAPLSKNRRPNQGAGIRKINYISTAKRSQPALRARYGASQVTRSACGGVAIVGSHLSQGGRVERARKGDFVGPNSAAVDLCRSPHRRTVDFGALPLRGSLRSRPHYCFLDAAWNFIVKARMLSICDRELTFLLKI